MLSEEESEVKGIKGDLLGVRARMGNAPLFVRFAGDVLQIGDRGHDYDDRRADHAHPEHDLKHLGDKSQQHETYNTRNERTGKALGIQRDYRPCGTGCSTLLLKDDAEFASGPPRTTNHPCQP